MAKTAAEIMKEYVKSQNLSIYNIDFKFCTVSFFYLILT